MSEDYGFANLGLDQPGSYDLPSYGIPVGTHHAHIKLAEIIPGASDQKKRNLHIVYEVDEPGSKYAGKTAEEYKPMNPGDTAKVKGYLMDRMFGLGFSREELATINARNIGSLLNGMPVYLTMWQPRDSQYTSVSKAIKDTDGQFTSVPQPAVSQSQPNAVSADSLGY